MASILLASAGAAIGVSVTIYARWDDRRKGAAIVKMLSVYAVMREQARGGVIFREVRGFPV